MGTSIGFKLSAISHSQKFAGRTKSAETGLCLQDWLPVSLDFIPPAIFEALKWQTVFKPCYGHTCFYSRSLKILGTIFFITTNKIRSLGLLVNHCLSINQQLVTTINRKNRSGYVPWVGISAKQHNANLQIVHCFVMTWLLCLPETLWASSGRNCQSSPWASLPVGHTQTWLQRLASPAKKRYTWTGRVGPVGRQWTEYCWSRKSPSSRGPSNTYNVRNQKERKEKK